MDSKATLLALNNADNKLRSDIIFEIKYMIHCLLAKGTTIVDLCWVPSHCGLFGDDRRARHGAFGNTLSHIDIPLSTREMFNILETRMKTNIHLSNCSYLKGPRHLVSLFTDFVSMLLKQSTLKISHVNTGTRYQPITFSLIVTSQQFFKKKLIKTHEVKMNAI